MKFSLARIVAAGGMQLSNESDIQAMNVVGEYPTKLIDNVGTAAQASEQGFEELDRKQSERSQVMGLRGSSSQSIQAEVAIIRNNQQYGPKQQQSDRAFSVLDSKSVQGINVFSHDKATFRTWNDKFINVFTQVRPNSRKLFATDGAC